MVVTYTTVAKVKSRLKKYNTSISDNEITEYIEHAEGIIKAAMKNKFTASFSSTKHGILESLATDLAAFRLLNYDPSSFTSATEASFIGDFLFTMIELQLKIIEDERIITALNDAS